MGLPNWVRLEVNRREAAAKLETRIASVEREIAQQQQLLLGLRRALAAVKD